MSACVRACVHIYISVCVCVYWDVTLFACWLADWLVCSFDRLRSFVHFIHTIIIPLYVLISHSHTPKFTTNAMSIYTYHTHTRALTYMNLYSYIHLKLSIHTYTEGEIHASIALVKYINKHMDIYMFNSIQVIQSAIGCAHSGHTCMHTYTHTQTNKYDWVDR